MENTATFNFNGSLKDFFSRSDEPVTYQFNQNPSVKDAIESVGIPHTEVDVIIVNTVAVDFNYRLKQGDQVEVYPHHSIWSSKHFIEGNASIDNGFVADVHAGGLARQLRMLGFDVIYSNQLSETAIINIGVQYNRVILTRSLPLLKQKQVKWGYWLRSQQTDEQLKEVMLRYDLLPLIKPFTRCIACNGDIKTVDKQQVYGQLPPKTRQYFNDFWQCTNCNRVYWKGSHYEHMEQIIKQLKEKQL